MLGEQKNIADDIILFLKTQEGRPTLIDEIILTVEKKNHSQDDIRYVIKMLKHKGFIQCTSAGTFAECFLSDKGWLYDNYDKVLAEEKYQADLAEQQVQSVIKTNKMQRWSFWASLITALAAIVVSLITVFKEKPNIINHTIILKDTVLNFANKDTLQLKIQLNQPGDTLPK
jgi:hypothetical protein